MSDWIDRVDTVTDARHPRLTTDLDLFKRATERELVYIRVLALAEGRGLIDVDELFDELGVPRGEGE